MLCYNFFCNIFYTLSNTLWCAFCLFSDNATGNLLVCPWTLVWYISMTFLDLLGQRVCTFCWWVLPNFLPETYYLSIFENAFFFTFLSSQGCFWFFKLLALNKQKPKSGFNFFITCRIWKKSLLSQCHTNRCSFLLWGMNMWK